MIMRTMVLVDAPFDVRVFILFTAFTHVPRVSLLFSLTQRLPRGARPSDAQIQRLRIRLVRQEIGKRKYFILFYVFEIHVLM